MKDTPRPEIKHYIDGKLVLYKVNKIVKKFSKSGHIILPNELVGEEVNIYWKKK